MEWKRRECLAALGSMAAMTVVPVQARTQDLQVLEKPIPSTGEMIPAVGLGSWITFNVGDDAELKEECAAVMQTFFSSGGKLIDSSPMYGSAQATIGYGVKKLAPETIFSADKVWISDAASGPGQIARSLDAWGIQAFSLLQVHNLLTWQEHLATLLDMKAKGQVKYVGITTSEGRRHSELEKIMAAQPIDFIQVSYNVLDREVESRILPLAAERGIAVIVNRPFRQGDLIDDLEGEALPDWISDTGATNWAQLLLRFTISHPAVTCAIPATSNPGHVRENMAAATGSFMTPELRRRTIEYVESL
jgi:diketogulonate reductase-like aldo/keto reductase